MIKVTAQFHKSEKTKTGAAAGGAAVTGAQGGCKKEWRGEREH